MVIDFHTHVFPEKVAAKAKQVLIDNAVELGNHISACTDLTVGGLVRHMEQDGVDMSVVLPIATAPHQTKHINEFAATLYEATGGKLLSFGSIHPDSDDYKRDIDMVVSLGLKGLKFHAEYQHFNSDDAHILKIYDYAFSKGLMIIHHCGADMSAPAPYHATPKQMAHILDEMKGGVLIAAHLGGFRMWEDVERYLVGREIYLDTSMGQNYYPREQFERIVNTHGADRILFASDSPWSVAGEEIKLINSTSLTEEQKKLIFGGNAKRLLGI